MKNILVIKLGALGDVVMATALIEAIMVKHVDASVHLLTAPTFVEIFQDWPGLRVTAFPRRGWRNTFAIIRWLRRERFARIYDLQANDRSGLWCALSGAGERVGNHPRYPYTHHPTTRWRGQCHIFERMREVLASAGIDAVADLPRLPCSSAAQERVAEWLFERGLGRPRLVLLHAGASPQRPRKLWPYFAELGERLQALAFDVVWLGAEPDRARNAELARRAGIDATGEFSITELAELGRHAAFAVTNDSGPMHVLAAAGIPLFGLFGPSDWRRNHALGQAARAIAVVDHGGSCDSAASGDCWRALSVEVVWSHLRAAGVLDD